MKVLLIDPWGIKNTSNYLNGLALGLSKNVDLTLMTNYYFQKTTAANYVVKKIFFKKSERIKDSFFRKFIRGVEYYIGYIKILKELKKVKYDVVHINWLLNYKQDVHFLKKIKKSFRLKIVYTAHNVLPHTNGNKRIRELNNVYSVVDRIIVHGNEIKKEFSSLFPNFKDKVFVQKHGCNLNPRVTFDISSIKSEIISILDSYERIYIFFGLIFYNKGVDRIINYWLKNNPKALLIIAGKKDSKYDLFEEQESIARQHKNIIILDNYIDDNLLNYLIFRSDLVLLPYRHASMSGVVFTASDFCKPVLTTDVGSISEYLEDKVDSFVVKKCDSALFKGISDSFDISKTKLKSMGQRLQVNIYSKCNWEKIGCYIVNNIYFQ